jgi:hypothetical protein
VDGGLAGPRTGSDSLHGRAVPADDAQLLVGGIENGLFPLSVETQVAPGQAVARTAPASL